MFTESVYNDVAKFINGGDTDFKMFIDKDGSLDYIFLHIILGYIK